MKHLKRLTVGIVCLVYSYVVYAESSYSIAGFYSMTKPASGAKAIGKNDKVVEVEYILVPTNMKTGKYIVEVKKIGDNLYQIKNTDICVETKYCHEWASYWKEVVLLIDSNYGYTKGKIIFD